ncbi:MAG: GNAT family N-acetyltransferase [Jiangellaceae bacterium]|nr:GNAT family N-acetyltransferase [Jiangellaceae bacterium]
MGPADLVEVVELLDRDPINDVFVASRVNGSGLSPGRLGGELWGCRRGTALTALCYSGANLVPVAADRAAAHAFAERAARTPRRCSSILGPSSAVIAMWERLRLDWTPARQVRPSQPLLVLDGPPAIAADPKVRRVRPDELDRLFPACVAMFTEEVGVAPVHGPYRSRIAELVAAGRAFARFEDGEVLFKAEVGPVTPDACQVQGVWVCPDRRGMGLSAPGMAAVVQQAQRYLAPVVTLYVNDFNTAARAAYRRTGFRQISEFATVLF